jgi:hypothetical protein
VERERWLRIERLYHGALEREASGLSFSARPAPGMSRCAGK